MPVPKKECQRCLAPTPATTTETLTTGGTKYRLHLCDSHSYTFSLALRAWILNAEETVDGERPRLFDATYRDDARRIAELRARDTDRQRQEREEREERERAAVQRQRETASVKRDLPFECLAWEISDHARERAELRGFDLRDVLLCAAKPEQTYTSGPKYGPDAAIHQRDDLALAVNTREKIVISVLHRTGETYRPDATRTDLKTKAAV